MTSKKAQQALSTLKNRKEKNMKYIVSTLIITFLLSSCAGKKQLETAREMSALIALPGQYSIAENSMATLADSLTTFTDKEGIQHTIGYNTLDEKTGEQLLTVGLQEVKITARFKTVAERKGLVKIAFKIQVPPELQNDNWELYLKPSCGITLPGIIVAGENFLSKQNRQYDYYRELCRVILPENDLSEFLNRKELEKALARHNRESLREAKLAYRKTLKVSPYQLRSKADTALFISKFMNKTKVNRNEYFKRVLAQKFRQIVTLPRRDSLKALLTARPEESLEYTYTAEIPATDATDRIIIALHSEIRSLNGDTYPAQISDSLSFVVSSLRSFVLEYTSAPAAYQRAIDLLKAGSYEQALETLRPYADRNTAIAYLALGFDRMAYQTLVSLSDCADNLYLLSIAASRLKKEKEAVELYQRAIEKDPTKRWRGNLDPEINSLIQKYQLNKDQL